MALSHQHDSPGIARKFSLEGTEVDATTDALHQVIGATPLGAVPARIYVTVIQGFHFPPLTIVDGEGDRPGAG
jgi:hypothetical protein